MVKNDAHDAALPLFQTAVPECSHSPFCVVGNPLASYLEERYSDKERFLDQLANNEKLAELGRLAAGIIHELNTPLSVIVSAAQMILQEREVPEYVTEMVERIGLEAQRLAQMTKGVLSFAGGDTAAAEEADVNELLREVLAFLKYEAQKRSITVIEALDFQLPAINADGNRLKQVFINLIMNALQAMGSGGYLTVKTSASSDHEIEIRIADTGPGIAPDLLARIFDPFFSTKDAKSGTGLGLFITRELVQTHGGSIRVESVEGNGATFFVTFPAAEAG